jgi:hypothetical protein
LDFLHNVCAYMLFYFCSFVHCVQKIFKNYMIPCCIIEDEE